MFPIVYDLSSDPGEQFNLMDYKLDMMWMFAPAFKALGEYMQRTAKYPNIKPGEEFSGYGTASDGSTNGAHDGQVKPVEYEHHHVPG
jgi:hypothetical protein